MHMAAFARLIIASTITIGAVADAQTVCGPYAPFGRVENADGTWTVGTYASCQIPDPKIWSHTYTLTFPSTITYQDGVTLQYVGEAQAYIEGKNNPVGRSCRKVTVDNASFTDALGTNYPLHYFKAGYLPYQYDEWITTTPLAPDTEYSFFASGTDPCINPTQDTLVINAVYQQVQTPAPTGDGVVISE